MKKHIKKQKRIDVSVIDNDEYFFRDNEMARPIIYSDVINNLYNNK